MIVCIVLLSAHPALSSGSSHLTTQKEPGDKVVYTFSLTSFPFAFISLVICWRRMFVWGAPGGRVTTVSVKICSKQAICPLTVSISSGRVEASAYWTKLGPAKPGVKCKATESLSSWQASFKRVKSRKKIPKLMWRPGGHTWKRIMVMLFCRINDCMINLLYLLLGPSDVLSIIFKGLQVLFQSGSCPQACSSLGAGTLDQLAWGCVAPQTAMTA